MKLRSLVMVDMANVINSRLLLFVILLSVIYLPLHSAVPKTALITGVSRGIGYALAENLLKRGISVVGVARAARAQRPGLLSYPQFSYFSADLSCSAGLADFDQFIHSNNFTFDIIVHNAAIINPAFLEHADLHELEKVIALNLLVPIKLGHILADTYRPQARIAYMSSGAATYPINQLGAYCISKAGLLMLAKMLRLEYAQRDIGIVSIMPGVVDTDMQRIIREDAQGDTQAEFQMLYDQGELISPEKCADYIAWLVCDVPFERFKKRAIWDIDEKVTFRSLYRRARSFFGDNFLS